MAFSNRPERVDAVQVGEFERRTLNACRGGDYHTSPGPARRTWDTSSKAAGSEDSFKQRKKSPRGAEGDLGGGGTVPNRGVGEHGGESKSRLVRRTLTLGRAQGGKGVVWNRYGDRKTPDRIKRDSSENVEGRQGRGDSDLFPGGRAGGGKETLRKLISVVKV